MKKGLVEIVFILDRSGSMASIKNDAIGGFNSFLEEQKKVPGEANLTLVLFDHEYNLFYNGVKLQNAKPLDNSTYVPRGTTALLDAVGRTIDDVGVRLDSLPEEDRPEKVIVGILTDGFENASKDYTNTRISEMIDLQQKTYNWEFLYLGANQDAFSVAQSLNIKGINTSNFVANSIGTRSCFSDVSLRYSKLRTQK